MKERERYLQNKCTPAKRTIVFACVRDLGSADALAMKPSVMAVAATGRLCEVFVFYRPVQGCWCLGASLSSCCGRSGMHWILVFVYSVDNIVRCEGERYFDGSLTGSYAYFTKEEFDALDFPRVSRTSKSDAYGT